VLRFAVLLLVGAISTAQGEGGRTTIEARAIIPPVGSSCDKWINAPEDTGERAQLRQWVLGYLSGINLESRDADFLRGRDADGLTAWIDSYCQRNPQHPLPQAVYQLILELRAGR
jgi:hypothetical protein